MGTTGLGLVLGYFVRFLSVSVLCVHLFYGFYSVFKNVFSSVCFEFSC